jgi:hypothetical protein
MGTYRAPSRSAAHMHATASTDLSITIATVECLPTPWLASSPVRT